MLEKAEKWLFRFVGDIEAWRGHLVVVMLLAFLLTGIAVGTALPPFQIADESNHWRMLLGRWLGLAGGKSSCLSMPPVWEEFVASLGHHMPVGIFANVAHQKLSCTPKIHMYGTLLTYPGALLSLMLFTGQTSTPTDFLRAFYAGRILQGMVVALALWRFARLTSKRQSPGALSVIAFLLCGLALQESFGVTADGVMFGFAVSLCGVMVAWDRLEVIDAVLFGLLGVAASTTKPFLTPAIVPALFAGFVNAQPADSRLGVLGSLRAFAKLALPRLPRVKLANAMMWIGLGLCVASVLSARRDFDTVAKRFDVTDQPSFLLHNPKVLLLDLPRSVLEQIHGPSDFMGPLGYLDAAISPDAGSAWFGLLLLATGLELAFLLPRVRAKILRRMGAVRDSDAAGKPRRGMGVARGVALAGVLLSGALCLYATILSLYLTWTRPGSRRVDGFQVRYVIPTVLICMGGLFAYLSTVCAPRPTYLVAPRAAHARTLDRLVVRSVVLAIAVAIALLSFSILSHLYYDISARYH